MKGKNTWCFVLFALIATGGYGQELFQPRPSPLALATTRYKDAYVKITYSQPRKRGRTVFGNGNLVPYGKVWRTGANEATEITTTHNILINNQPLPAGTYSIFTIPRDDEWTVIINADVGLWGSYNYNPKRDVIRFNVPVLTNTAIFEAFTMIFESRNELADLLIMWDDVKIVIPVKFTN